MKVIMNPWQGKGVVICQSSCKTRAANASLLDSLPVRVCTDCFTVCSAVQHAWDNTYEFLMHTPIHIPCVTNISSASFSLTFVHQSRELAPFLQTSFTPTVKSLLAVLSVPHSVHFKRKHLTSLTATAPRMSIKIDQLIISSSCLCLLS